MAAGSQLEAGQSADEVGALLASQPPAVTHVEAAGGCQSKQIVPVGGCEAAEVEAVGLGASTQAAEQVLRSGGVANHEVPHDVLRHALGVQDGRAHRQGDALSNRPQRTHGGATRSALLSQRIPPILRPTWHLEVHRSRHVDCRGSDVAHPGGITSLVGAPGAWREEHHVSVTYTAQAALTQREECHLGEQVQERVHGDAVCRLSRGYLSEVSPERSDPSLWRGGSVRPGDNGSTS